MLLTEMNQIMQYVNQNRIDFWHSWQISVSESDNVCNRMEAFGVWSPDNSGKESNVSLDFVQFSQMARQLSPLPPSRVLSAKLPKVILDETQSLKGTVLVNAWEAGFCGSHER